MNGEVKWSKSMLIKTGYPNLRGCDFLCLSLNLIAFLMLSRVHLFKIIYFFYFFFYCFTGPHWISPFVKWAPCIKIVIIIMNYQWVSEHIFKHLKVLQKYSPARRTFNSLLRCWELWPNALFRVWYIAW